MDKPIYLYLKEHNVTGLKYLGQTIQDPHVYEGSGTRWRNHLKVHGKDIKTSVLKICKSYEELKEWGLHYSEMWNIVESDEFANLIMELGTEPHIPSSKTQDNSDRIGSYWVTNGVDNKLMQSGSVSIPAGYYRGRTVKKPSKQTRKKMSESALKRPKRPRKKFEYQCAFCKKEFIIDKQRNAEKTYCSAICRSKVKRVSNPLGNNQYTKKQ